MAGVQVERTQLQAGPDGLGQRAVGTGQMEALPADLVLQSIGYRSEPMRGVPFDAKAGIIPNRCGQHSVVSGLERYSLPSHSCAPLQAGQGAAARWGRAVHPWPVRLRLGEERAHWHHR